MAKPIARNRQKDTKPRKARVEPTDVSSDEPFPPLSIDAPVWLRGGSDTHFRELVYNLLSFSSQVLKSRESFAAYIGVTAPQHSILMAVAEAGEVSVGQVAAALHVTSPFATAELRKLEKRGLIVRRTSPSDARSTIVTLTPLAKQLIREVAPMRRMVNEVVYGSLTAEEAAQLYRLVSILQERATHALHMLDGPNHRNARAPSLQRDLDEG